MLFSTCRNRLSPAANAKDGILKKIQQQNSLKAIAGTTTTVVGQQQLQQVRLNATAAHYEAHTAESYEQSFFSEHGNYMKYLVNLVGDRLMISDNSSSFRSTIHRRRRKILDVGGGTGNFAGALVKGHPHCEAVVIDPFLDPTDTIHAENKDQVSFAKEPAEIFMEEHLSSSTSSSSNNNNNNDWWRKEFHQVLLKEIVHHLNPEDRVEIFRGMYKELQPVITTTTTTAPTPDQQPPPTTTSSSSSSSLPPSILIITRPSVDHDYPLWKEAQDVWVQNQPSHVEFEQELKMAGFVNVHTTLESYPCQLPLERWQSMVQNRFWSTFSNFSDEELEQACHDMETIHKHRLDNDGNLHFEDRLVFISGVKTME